MCCDYAPRPLYGTEIYTMYGYQRDNRGIGTICIITTKLSDIFVSRGGEVWWGQLWCFLLLLFQDQYQSPSRKILIILVYLIR